MVALTIPTAGESEFHVRSSAANVDHMVGRAPSRSTQARSPITKVGVSHAKENQREIRTASYASWVV